jgi:hypothetical protein
MEPYWNRLPTGRRRAGGWCPAPRCAGSGPRIVGSVRCLARTGPRGGGPAQPAPGRSRTPMGMRGSPHGPVRAGVAAALLEVGSVTCAHFLGRSPPGEETRVVREQDARPVGAGRGAAAAPDLAEGRCCRWCFPATTRPRACRARWPATSPRCCAGPDVAEVRVVDDGSADQTVAVACAAAASDPRVRVAASRPNRARGSRCASGCWPPWGASPTAHHPSRGW